MFVDIAQVRVKAGDGGNGVVSFRHEKFVDRGGPDGGDGGDGGDVVVIGSRNQDSLANFRFQKLLKAQDGQNGSKQRKHGRNGQHLEVAVPVGTVVMAEDGRILADITHDGQKEVIASGGKGGFGNAHFVSSTRQAPRVAEKGEQGKEIEVTLELKMIADVGLVGLPNAGKSTLLSSVSNAHPKVANYPFTTLAPHLGVVDLDKTTSLLMADIPGLIEGASKGKGLGDEFLRHIERTAVLLHLIDIYQEDIAMAYKTIQKELQAYKVDLSKRPQIVVLSKVDGLDDDIIQDKLSELKKVVPRSVAILPLSARSKQGVSEILFALKKEVQKARTKAEKSAAKKPSLPIIQLARDDGWTVSKQKESWLISGKKIDRFAARTDFDSEPGVQRLRDIMTKMGIVHELTRQGAKNGQKIVFPGHGSIEF